MKNGNMILQEYAYQVIAYSNASHFYHKREYCSRLVRMDESFGQLSTADQRQNSHLAPRVHGLPWIYGNNSFTETEYECREMLHSMIERHAPVVLVTRGKQKRNYLEYDCNLSTLCTTFTIPFPREMRQRACNNHYAALNVENMRCSLANVTFMTAYLLPFLNDFIKKMSSYIRYSFKKKTKYIHTHSRVHI